MSSESRMADAPVVTYGHYHIFGVDGVAFHFGASPGPGMKVKGYFFRSQPSMGEDASWITQCVLNSNPGMQRVNLILEEVPDATLCVTGRDWRIFLRAQYGELCPVACRPGAPPVAGAAADAAAGGAAGAAAGAG
jgi:hypothetical protein